MLFAVFQPLQRSLNNRLFRHFSHNFWKDFRSPGFDSGFGAKPALGPLLAFATAMGLLPDQVVMVGDSPHDLIAGRAARMHTIGVLTGLASRIPISWT